MAVEGSTRRRLQKALTDLSRASRGRGDSQRRHVVIPPVEPPVIREQRPAAEPPRPALRQAVQPVEPGSLDRKLDRIERMLAEMRTTKSPTSEIFTRWIKQGYWAHIRFGDYLSLERTGLI